MLQYLATRVQELLTSTGRHYAIDTSEKLSRSLLYAKAVVMADMASNQLSGHSLKK